MVLQFQRHGFEDIEDDGRPVRMQLDILVVRKSAWRKLVEFSVLIPKGGFRPDFAVIDLVGGDANRGIMKVAAPILKRWRLPLLWQDLLDYLPQESASDARSSSGRSGRRPWRPRLHQHGGQCAPSQSERQAGE